MELVIYADHAQRVPVRSDVDGDSRLVEPALRLIGDARHGVAEIR